MRAPVGLRKRPTDPARGAPMLFFGKRQTKTIRVSLNLRAFVGGRMVRASLDAQAREGDRIRDLLKRLGREGTLEPSVVRFILERKSVVTLLQNGNRLDMPKGASAALADGDTLSILTPVAGG
jgi:molybdopterin converting factor small subunit